MTRKNTVKTEQPAPEKKVEAPAEVVAEETATKDPAEPANIEVQASEEPVAAPKAQSAESIQTDFREKLTNKSVEENIFVPSNPVALEKAAAQVAQENGFELTRGTSIGARLIARAQKKV